MPPDGALFPAHDLGHVLDGHEARFGEADADFLPDELGQGHGGLDGARVVHVFQEPALRARHVAGKLFDGHRLPASVLRGAASGSGPPRLGATGGCRRRCGLRLATAATAAERARRRASRFAGRDLQHQPGLPRAMVAAVVVQADHRLHVDDQGDLAVSEDRGADEALDLAVVAAEALDDHFPRAEDPLDLQADLPPSKSTTTTGRPSGAALARRIASRRPSSERVAPRLTSASTSSRRRMTRRVPTVFRMESLVFTISRTADIGMA